VEGGLAAAADGQQVPSAGCAAPCAARVRRAERTAAPLELHHDFKYRAAVARARPGWLDARQRRRAAPAARH